MLNRNIHKTNAKFNKRKNSQIFFLNLGLLCLIFISFVAEVVAEVSSPFIHKKLRLGNNSVGYKRLSVQDFSANAQPRFDFLGNEVETNHKRSIPISFWYPANTKTGNKQFLIDYVNSYVPGKSNKDITPQDKLIALNNFSQYPLEQGANQSDLDNLLTTPMLAKRDAEFKPGKYPLILIPGGFYANFFIAPTAEYFASHGYVVAYINDAVSTGISGYSNPKDLLWRFSDLKFVINYLAQFPNVQWNNIGVWGYHSGGSVATLLQMQSDNVRAVVSVEGSESWTSKQTGYPALKQVSLFDPNRVKVPYMRFQSMNPEPNWYISTPEKTTWAFYDQIKYGNVYRIFLSESEHENLSDGIRETVIPETIGRDNKEQHLYLSYGLNFFDYNLKQKNDGLEYINLQPSKNGFPDGFANIEISKTLPSPPQKSDLKRVYELSGVKALEQLVNESLKLNKSAINAKLLGDLAQDYVWAEKNSKAGLEITDVATRVFESDYWGPYLAGFIYGRENITNKKIELYKLAKQRLLQNKTIEQDEKEKRLKRIESALQENN